MIIRKKKQVHENSHIFIQPFDSQRVKQHISILKIFSWNKILNINFNNLQLLYILKIVPEICSVCGHKKIELVENTLFSTRV